MPQRPHHALIIGTRGSPLALTQANMVRDALLSKHNGLVIDIKIIRTSGDWDPKDGETRLPTKALFAKEIETALMKGEIDIAVHSMKDMDSALPEGLVINHMLPREDVRDCLIIGDHVADKHAIRSLEDLPRHSVIGTSSVRRAAMMLAVRPDIKIQTMRGNVGTRIEKLHAATVDATFLALAGLKRLDMAHHVDLIIPAEEMIPAAGQGAIGIEIRTHDHHIAKLLDPISCENTVLCVKAERAVLTAMQGSCDTPIGAYATLNKDGHMEIKTRLYSLDGQAQWAQDGQADVQSVDEAEALGLSLGRALAPHV